MLLALAGALGAACAKTPNDGDAISGKGVKLRDPVGTIDSKPFERPATSDAGGFTFETSPCGATTPRPPTR